MAVVRSIIGILVGYAALVVLITVVQEVIFGGVGYHESPLYELIIAGLLTFGSAVAGGLLAGIIAGRAAILHVLPMCAAVAAETTWLIQSGRADGPLWFDIAAGGSLIVGLIVGAIIAGIMRAGIRRANNEADLSVPSVGS